MSDTRPSDTMRLRTRLRAVAGLALFWSSIVALVFASLMIAWASTQVTPIWLPGAIVLAALVRRPRAQWPGLAAVAFTAFVTANAAAGRPLVDNLFYASLNILGPVLAALGIHSSTNGIWHFSSRSIRNFVLHAVLASATLATISSCWLLVFDGVPFLETWPEWFLSVCCGYLIGTPFILAWAEPALRPRLRAWMVGETALMGLMVAAATYAALTSPLPLLFLVFPVLAGVTARGGLVGATVGIVAFSGTTMWCMVDDLGVLAALGSRGDFVQMLVWRAYLLTGVVATLPIAVILALRGVLDRLMDNMIQGVAMFDGYNRLIICNHRFAQLYGLSRAMTARGTAISEIVLPDGRPVARPLSACWTQEEGALAERSHVELDDGRVVEVQYRTLPGKAWISTHEDVTAKRLADRRIAHLASHDPLTELANRAAFRSELDRHIAAIAAGESFAIHSIDLDRFKAVNDTLGHAAGDELLRQVAQRLREETRNSDFVARLGGDEFAIIQAPLAGVDEAQSLAMRVIEALSWPFEVNGQEARIGASVGISHAPLHGDCQSELLQKSDIALYRSKSDGRNRYCIYEPGMDALLQERRQLETELRAAIQMGQFVIHYQPLLDIETGEISTIEALVRWDHPTRGLLPPSEFIAAAEETGLIVAIGEWVLRHACYEAAQWPLAAKLAVNFSPVQFKSPNLLKLIMSALTSSGLPPERLEIEITESLLLEDTDDLLTMLNQLHAAGISIAMDDFGTGYSSLSYLRKFPFDKIKIDQTFVKDIGSNGESQAIVQATTQLSQQLGMSTTAEGVETREQLDMLREKGCTEAQGFYFSNPLPADELRELLSPKEQRPARAGGRSR